MGVWAHRPPFGRGAEVDIDAIVDRAVRGYRDAMREILGEAAKLDDQVVATEIQRLAERALMGAIGGRR